VSSGSPTTSQIRAQVGSIHKKSRDARVIGIRSSSGWDGAELDVVDDREYQFVQCNSVLQVREALVSRDLAQAPLVVITDLEESELGDDILARFAKGRLHRVRPWDVLLEHFQARKVDPSLVGKHWLANVLLQNVPATGYPVVPSGVLDEETVWGIVLREHLGFESVRPDAQDLLEWSIDRAKLSRFAASSPEMREGVRQWIAQSSGEVGDLILLAIDAGFGQEVLPIGLVCDVVSNKAADTKAKEAAVRLERFTGNKRISTQNARAWAVAAGNVIDKLDAEGQREPSFGFLERGDRILKELHIENFSYLSEHSPLGFEQRLDRYGRRLDAVLSEKPETLPDDLLTMAEEVLDHARSRMNKERTERVKMSLRLTRWLLEKKRVEASSFEDAARSYSKDGGFVDWARYQVFSGDNAEKLSIAYSRLAAMIAERRDLENKRFGELLANWTELGSPGDNIIRIEEVLEQVIAKIATNDRVLMIVADGMSWAALHEILEDVSGRGWTEIGPEGGEQRPVVAGLPSVTQVSRASLLCGRPSVGSSAVEANGFKANSALLKVSKSGYAPVLFHKNTLTESSGTNLATEVRNEIASDKRQVVGVVINAIDDHLSKGSQIAVPWTLRTIPVLDQLLGAARDAERVVVLTSDHGHIIERESTYQGSDPGERYRSNDGEPLLGELVIRGSRVMLPDDGQFIAPWTEGVRYAAKKHGYHGGISPQECVVPITVLVRLGNGVEGWQPRPMDSPDWWYVGDYASRSVLKGLQQTDRVTLASISTPIAMAEDLPLFAAAEQEISHREDSWIAALLLSPTFLSQTKSAGSAAPRPDLVRTFLVALEERGGKILKRVLAQKLEQPELRINGIIAAMRRLLNVDGYAVLSVEEDTIALNLELLKIQFGLETES
jgi:hypothetical protein